MKLLNRIVCLFKGHIPWGSQAAVCITHPDFKNSASVSLEVCPRCETLWPNIGAPRPKLELEYAAKLSDITFIPMPNPTFECEFLDEAADTTFKVYVSCKTELLDNEIEIESEAGRFSAWNIDVPPNGMYTPDDQTNLHLQLGNLLTKTQDPRVLYVPKSVYAVLDYSIFSTTSLTRGLRQAITSTFTNTPTQAQNPNASGTVQQKKPISTGVPGIGSNNKF